MFFTGVEVMAPPSLISVCTVTVDGALGSSFHKH
jgi:hypothetical protein